MKTKTLLVVGIVSMLSPALPARTMWQPNFAFRVMVAFDEKRGIETVPLYDSLPLPGFPLEMRRAHVGGDVDFEFTVLKDGSIADVVLHAKFPQFQAALVDAMKLWRFFPLSTNGPTFPDKVRLKGKVRFDMPEDVELEFPYVGRTPTAKKMEPDERPFGITYELDEVTGKRKY